MLLRSSFGGSSCTSVVVNVSSEAEHADETVCSLRFGTRCRSVQTKSRVVKGQDEGWQLESARRALQGAQTQLERLAAEGHGPRLGGGASSEQRSFLQNEQRFAGYKKSAAQHKVGVLELRAAKAPVSAIRAMEAKLANDAAQRDNLRDILLRQKSIKVRLLSRS